MTTLKAAASTTTTTTKSLSLDFATKSTPSSGESSGFASKLQDARRDAQPESSKHAIDAKKSSAEKPKPADDAVDRLEATADAKRAKPAKKPSDDRPTDDADDAQDSDEKKPAETKPAAKSSEDALLAALAASATPVAAAPSAPAEAKPEDATTTPAVAAAAAAATIQANAPAAVDDQPAVAADAKPNAVQSADAKSKPADAKLDALTAKLKPVNDPNAPLPPDASEQRAGGDAQKHSSHGQQQPSGDGNAPAAQAADVSAAPAVKADATKEQSFDDLLSKLATPDVQTPRDAPAPTSAPATPTLRPEQQFARDNVDRVVSTVQSHVEAGGNGTMNVRLDPPELGALDVAAKMLDGKMSVSFTTSNEQATQLLSHSLNHLKSSLESAGIAVDRIEVRQGAATSTNASGDRDSSGQQQPGGRGFESASQQQGEQQRKQMVEKLWRKYAYGSDEVDLVA